MLLIMWQNFAAIGRGTSEISRRKKDETAVKHKAFPNYREHNSIHSIWQIRTKRDSSTIVVK